MVQTDIFRIIADLQTKVTGKSALQALNREMEVTKKRNEVIRNVMKKTGMSANDSAQAIRNIGFKFYKTGDAVDALGNKMKLSRKNLDAMKKSMIRFNMSALSGLFFFMALKNAVGGFLRGAIQSYNRATDENSAFRAETNKLTAAWEFFKFSLIDALSQSELFKGLIDVLVRIVNWFNALTPKTKALIALTLGFIFVAASVAFLWYTLSLARTAFTEMKIAGANALNSLGIASFGELLLALALIVLLILGAIDGWKKFKKAKEGVEKPEGIYDLADAFSFLGKVVNLLVQFLGIGFSVIFMLIDSLIIFFQVGLTHIITKFKIFGLELKAAFTDPIGWIISKFISLGKKIVSVWNIVRSAFGKDPISVDFSSLEQYTNGIDTIKKQIQDLKDEDAKYAKESGKYIGDSWKSLLNNTPTFEEMFKSAGFGNQALQTQPTSQVPSGNSSTTTNMNIENISLPAVQNAQDFVDQLSQLQSDELYKSIGSTNE